VILRNVIGQFEQSLGETTRAGFWLSMICPMLRKVLAEALVGPTYFQQYSSNSMPLRSPRDRGPVRRVRRIDVAQGGCVIRTHLDRWARRRWR
jgi:hypothetical protein